MSRSTNTEQSVGFILSVEANTLVKDLKKAEDQYTRLDRSLVRLAKSSRLSANTIDEAMDKVGTAFGGSGKRTKGDSTHTKSSRAEHSASTSSSSRMDAKQYVETKKRATKVEKLTEKIVANTKINGVATGKTSAQLLQLARVVEKTKNNVITQRAERPQPKATDSPAHQTAFPGVSSALPMTAATEQLVTKSVKAEELVVKKQQPELALRPNASTGSDPVTSVELETKTADSLAAIPASLRDLEARFTSDLLSVSGRSKDLVDLVHAALDAKGVPQAPSGHNGESAFKSSLHGDVERQNYLSQWLADNSKASPPTPNARRGKPKPGNAPGNNPTQTPGIKGWESFIHDVPDTGAWKAFLHHVAPEEWSRPIVTGMNLIRVATGKTEASVGKFFHTTLGAGAVAEFSVFILMVGKATVAAAAFQETMDEVKRSSAATADQLTLLEGVTLDVAKNTGHALGEVANVAGTLYGKGGFAKINGDFRDIVETSVKMSQVLDVNANEMAEFLAETTVGMDGGVKSADKLAASLLGVTQKGGISFQALRQSVLATKDVIRRFAMDQDHNLKLMEATAVAAQQFSKNYGDAADAQNILSAATNRTSADYYNLLRIIGQSGDQLTMPLEEMATKDFPRLMGMLIKGSKNFMDANGKAWAAFPDQIERVVGSTTRVVALSKMSLQDFNKTVKEAQKAGGKNEIDDEFKEMMKTVTGLKSRIANLFEMFMVYVGKPLLAPVVEALSLMLSVVQAIPSPLLKTAGIMLSIWLYVKGIQTTLKAIMALKAIAGLAGGAKGVAGAVAGAAVETAGVAAASGAATGAAEGVAGAASAGILARQWSKLTGLFKAAAPAAAGAAATTGRLSKVTGLLSGFAERLTGVLPKALGLLGRVGRIATGPIGLAIAAVAGYFFAVKHNSEAVEQFMRDTNRKSLGDYEDSLDKRKELDEMYVAAHEAMAKGDMTAAAKLFDQYYDEYKSNKQLLLHAEKAFQADRVDAAIDAGIEENRVELKFVTEGAKERALAEKTARAKAAQVEDAKKSLDGTSGSWWDTSNAVQQGFWETTLKNFSKMNLHGKQSSVSELEQALKRDDLDAPTKRGIEAKIASTKAEIANIGDNPYLPIDPKAALTDGTVEKAAARRAEASQARGDANNVDLTPLSTALADGSKAEWATNDLIYRLLAEVTKRNGGSDTPSLVPQANRSRNDTLAVNGGGGG